MSFKNKRKLAKCLGYIIGIALMIIFGLIVYSSYSEGEFNFDGVWKYTTIVIIVFFVLLFTLGPILFVSYKKRIKSKYEMRRFKYVDTFYYKKYDIKVERTEFNFYHVIQDIDSKKYYCISKDSTNSQVEVDLDGKVTVFRGQGLRNKWQTVRVGDEGSFWIKEELNDFYKRDGSDIILEFDVKLLGIDNKEKKEPKNNVPLLINANKENDISLLDKCIFIDGLLEFDMK